MPERITLLLRAPLLSAETRYEVSVDPRRPLLPQIRTKFGWGAEMGRIFAPRRIDESASCVTLGLREGATIDAY